MVFRLWLEVSDWLWQPEPRANTNVNLLTCTMRILSSHSLSEFFYVIGEPAGPLDARTWFADLFF